MRDWRQNYRREHKDELDAYRKEWFKKRGEAKRLERETKRAEREAAKSARFADWEERCRIAKEQYGFDLGVVPIDMTPEEAEARKRYERDRDREYRESHKEERRAQQRAYDERKRRKAERRKCNLANLDKAREAQKEIRAKRKAEAAEAKRLEAEKLREEQRRAFEEKQRIVREKYGFTLGVAPKTPEEIAGKKRYIFDQKKAYLEANKEHLDEKRRLRQFRKAEECRRRQELLDCKRRENAELERQAWLVECQKRREEREAEAAALAKSERQARDAFATEREANRQAYLAAMEAKKNETAIEESIVPEPTVPAMPPIEPPDEPVVATGGSEYDGEEQDAEPELDAREAELRKREQDFTRRNKARNYKFAAKKRKATIERKKREAQKADAKAERAEWRRFKSLRLELGLSEDKSQWTEKQLARYERKVEKAKLEKKRAEHRKEIKARKKAKAAARRERRDKIRAIREKYGFTLGKAPRTEAEKEGKKRWERDKLAEERERNREHLNAYNREYKRRKRAEALAKAQRKWTDEQWAEWNKREAARQYPSGSPQWLVREVVKRLASEQNLPEDAVTQRLLDLGGIEFLTKGVESFGEKGYARTHAVQTAIDALSLFLDPDHAAMFRERRGDV